MFDYTCIPLLYIHQDRRIAQNRKDIYYKNVLLIIIYLIGQASGHIVYNNI